MPPSTAVLESSTQNDVSNEAFPYMTTRFIDIAGVSVWAQRISYTGELGWELYIPWEDGLKVWDAFMNAGESCGVQPFGYKALDTLRIEKGYLYWSGDITPVDNPFEAGLGFCVDLDKDNFIVRETLRTIKKSGPKTKLSAIALDANFGLFGGESVYSSGKLVDRIRSAATVIPSARISG